MEIAFFPRWIFGGIEDGRRRHLNYWLSAMTLAITVPYFRLIPHVCLFQWLLGTPCPGCGVTRALAAICRLDFSSAVKANPAAFPIALLLIFQISIRPFALVSSSPRFVASIDSSSRFISLCASFSLFVVWIAKLVAR